ncbi:MAG: AAC(3) family N-acetyltransferase [Alphaproteobacteria bacterium]|nr:AAC(3) family N-acetyltransferase [Alphaproteobacteria bacterium]
MKTTTLDEMNQHLDDLGLSKSMEALVIHSSLISFGRLDFSIEALFDLIRAKIALEATIFVPTFTLKLTEEDVFDVSETPSHGMGVFSEYVRKLPEAVRANNPMHSYTGIGPKADILKTASETLSFGQNSCFEKMLELDPHLLLLGCPFHHGATHIHQKEAEMGVPYRLWLDLKRKVRGSEGDIEDITFKYYGVRRDIEVNWTPARVIEHLKAQNQLTELPLDYGKSYSMRLFDLDLAAQNIIKQDANGLNL